MKKVSELGLAALPWQVKSSTYQCLPEWDNVVYSADGNIQTVLLHKQDALMQAAAPECYEALRMILEVLDGCGFQPIVEGDPLAVAVKCGQEAIKKATGEK